MDLKQGDLENIILNALWDLENEGLEKIYVGHIQERIKTPNKKWAYTTVKTVLDRLVDKEVAVREKDGKKYLYHSVVNRDDAGLLAIQKVIRQYFKNDVDEMLSCLGRINNGSVAALAHEKRVNHPERDNAYRQLAETRAELVNR